MARLITETAETAYKANHEPRVPLMLGSNSADTAGNRIQSDDWEQLWAHFGQCWSAEEKTYDPDRNENSGNAEYRRRTMILRAKPNRLALQRVRSRKTARPFYIYRGSHTFRRECGNGLKPGHRTAAKLHSSSAR